MKNLNLHQNIISTLAHKTIFSPTLKRSGEFNYDIHVGLYDIIMPLNTSNLLRNILWLSRGSTLQTVLLTLYSSSDLYHLV